MGVLGLWDLLAPIGRIISIETLEGKRLAIDMSIWLTQFIKAMRNEDGTMIKNAHLIGTIKRLLKLLYNKVKPVFVFDGGVPILKLKTIEARTKLRSRNEQTVESTARRLLLTKLKQRELNKLSEKSSTSSSNYASSFNPSPYKNSAQSQDIPHSSHDHVVKIEPKFANDEINDDIMWLNDNLEPLQRAKSLEEEEEELNDGNDDDTAYALPDNMDDLSPETLANLPLYMRKNVIIDARRRERMRSRAQFIPVADDPLLYSQTQVANFLKVSRLNKRIFEIQKVIEGDAQQDGKTIAAQSGKRYIMIQPSDVSSSTNSKIQKLVDKEFSRKSIQVDEDEEWLDDLDEEINMVETYKSGDPNFLSRNSSEVLVKHSKVANSFSHNVQNNHGSNINAVVVSAHDNERLRDDAADENTEEFRAAIALSLEESASSLSATTSIPPASSTVSIAVDTVDENAEEFRAAIALSLEESASSLSATIVMPLVPVIPNNGDVIKFSMADSVISNERTEMSKMIDTCLNDDIQWESDDEITSRDIISSNLRINHNSASNHIDSAANYVQSVSNPIHVPSTSSHSISQDTVARALSTASSMTDWAVKEVQKVFKNHIPPLPSNSAVVDLSSITDDIPKNFVLSTEILDLTDDADSNTNYLDKNLNTLSSKIVDAPLDIASAAVDVTKTSSNSGALLEDVTSTCNRGESGVVDRSSCLENAPFVSPEDIQHMLFEEEMQESAIRNSQVNALRDAEKITEMMRIEVMQLLDAFSIPYIVAPFEAEAQCAVLEELGLVDGVITEDSDVFLFGAKTVYKNIFKDKQNVEVYMQSDIISGLGLSREELIGLAYFLGSDYTEGVLGVGIVNAVEIIQCFPMKQKDGGPIEGLNKFKKWLDSYNFADTVKRMKSKRKRAFAKDSVVAGTHDHQADSGESDDDADAEEVKLAEFTERHHHGRSKWKVDGNFPDKRVADAYMKPPANRDVTPFEFGAPMLHRARGYCNKVLGWSESEMNTQIDPVIKRFAENSRQGRIDSYFMKYEDDKRFAKIQSNRLAKALDLKISEKPNSSKKTLLLSSPNPRKAAKKQKK